MMMMMMMMMMMKSLRRRRRLEHLLDGIECESRRAKHHGQRILFEYSSSVRADKNSAFCAGKKERIVRA